MALISTSGFDSTNAVVTGQALYKLLTGGVSLRASHTFMIRVKHGLTTTNYDSLIISYTKNAYSNWPEGSFVGRANGIPGTALGSYRADDGLFPAVDGGNIAATCYGNTTTWYHVTYAYDAPNNLIRTYINGTASTTFASTTTRTTASTSNGLIVGGHNGKFADAAFFTRLLSPSEILSMASYRQPQVTSGLIAFWRLDSSAADTSPGGSNTGAIVGTTPTVSYSTADNPPQPEDPIVDLDVDMASSTSFSGTLGLQQRIAAAAASSSALSGALNTAKPVAAAAASSSSFSPTLGTTKPVVATASSDSALSGALSTTKPVAVAATSDSALAGSLVQQQAVAGAAASDSAFSGTINSLLPVAVAAASSSALSGNLTQQQLVAGVAASSSAFFAALSTVKPIAGTLASSSAFTGVINVPGSFVGLMGSFSGFIGSLTQDLAYDVALVSDSAFSGTLSSAVAGDFSSSSAFAAAMTGLANGTMISDSAFAAVLSGGTSPIVGGGGTQDAHTLRRGSALGAGRRSIRG